MNNNTWVDFLVNYAVPALIAFIFWLSKKYFPQAADASAQKRIENVYQNGNGNGKTELFFKLTDSRVDDLSKRVDAQSKDIDNLETNTRNTLETMRTTIINDFTKKLKEFNEDVRERFDGQHNINKDNWKARQDMISSIRLLEARVKKLEQDKAA